jgi:hypothetical protein
VIEVDPETPRLVAELWVLPDRVVWADCGWPEGSPHPFHMIEGATAREPGTDGWEIGDSGALIRVLAEGEELYQDWLGWKAWRETDEGRPFDRAAAECELRDQGFL